MNMSRIALLSAVFCATSMFASETPVTGAVTDQPGMISKVTGFVKTPFVFADSAASWIADKSYLTTIIGKITGVSFLKDRCVNNPELIGKSLVALTAVYVAYKLYQQLNDQNVDNDDDMIFVDEEYVE